MTKAIIFFDGVCNLCQASVRFIIPRDPQGYFQFASLQSRTARERLSGKPIDLDAVNSVVLLEQGKLFTESSAALRISRKLNGGWFLLYGFMFIPKPLRDIVYRFIAKRRYRWFGQSSACMLPKPEHRSRFLDEGE